MRVLLGRPIFSSQCGEERVTAWKFVLPQKLTEDYHNCDLGWSIVAKSFRLGATEFAGGDGLRGAKAVFCADGRVWDTAPTRRR
jgi:hypothetical protein